MWRRAAALIVLSLAIVSGWGTGAHVASVVHAQQPLEIFLTQFSFEEQPGSDSGSYYVLVSITDPSRVGRLDPRLLDLQTGEDIRFGDTVPVTSAEMDFRLPTEQLQTGKKYKLAIRAFDGDSNTYIRRPTQSPADNPLIFASQEFAYNPPKLAPIVFALDGVSADFPNHLLLIALHHSDTTRLMRYEAVIIDKKKGGAVGRLERANMTLKNGILEAPIPAAMERTDQPAEYELSFRLFTSDNKLVGEQRKEFTLPAPPVPSLVERITQALNTYPWLGWSIAGIVACLTGVYLFRKFVPKKRKPMPRPQNLEPVYIKAPGGLLGRSLQPAMAQSLPTIETSMESQWLGLFPPGGQAAQAAHSTPAAPPRAASVPAQPPAAAVRPQPAASAPAQSPIAARSQPPASVQPQPTAAAPPQPPRPPTVTPAPPPGPVRSQPAASVPTPPTEAMPAQAASPASVQPAAAMPVQTPPPASVQPAPAAPSQAPAPAPAQPAAAAPVPPAQPQIVVRSQPTPPPPAPPQPQVVVRVQPPMSVPAEPSPAAAPPAAKRPWVLVIRGVDHPLTAGAHIEARQLDVPGLADGPFADVTSNPEDPLILGLRNLTPTAWQVTRPNGQKLLIENGRSVRLDDGVTINFGTVEGRIQA